MSDFIIVVALAIVAIILSAIGLVRSKGQDLNAWAILAVAIAVVVSYL